MNGIETTPSLVQLAAMRSCNQTSIFCMFFVESHPNWNVPSEPPPPLFFVDSSLVNRLLHFYNEGDPGSPKIFLACLPPAWVSPVAHHRYWLRKISPFHISKIVCQQCSLYRIPNAAFCQIFKDEIGGLVDVAINNINQQSTKQFTFYWHTQENWWIFHTSPTFFYASGVSQLDIPLSNFNSSLR